MTELTSTSPLIYDMDLNQLTGMVQSWGEPTYRAKQIWQGIYCQLWDSAQAFSPLPAGLRAKMADELRLTGLTPSAVLKSSDGQTVKTLFHLSDGRAIEAVLMRYEHRQTLCISSQAGCAMGCSFCATGQMGFKRHLTSGEIVEQVLYYARMLKQEGKAVTNIVVMGMGEPFHNYDNTLAAIDRLNHSDGFNLGARRFTISTVGLVPMIRKFAAERRQINLAISLHASDDQLRSSMMPVNNKYPIAELIQACREYIEATGRRLTFEWALIQGVNDTPEQARALAALLKGMLCHVNVIPLNPTHKFAGTGSTRQRAEAFRAELESAGIPCTVRMRRGIDIQAGCGQLATEHGK
jgi:23S rRNA (adenine2503-C2)-methyltransferase